MGLALTCVLTSLRGRWKEIRSQKAPDEGEKHKDGGGGGEGG